MGLNDGRITEGEGVDQTWPGFEAPDAAAANPPAANDPFGGVVGGWHLVLFEEKAIAGPIIAQTKQQFLQAG